MMGMEELREIAQAIVWVVPGPSTGARGLCLAPINVCQAYRLVHEPDLHVDSPTANLTTRGCNCGAMGRDGWRNSRIDEGKLDYWASEELFGRCCSVNVVVKERSRALSEVDLKLEWCPKSCKISLIATASLAVL